MLLRTPGHIEAGFFLCSLGESFHYVVAAEIPLPLSPLLPRPEPRRGGASSVVPREVLSSLPFVLFDPGTSAHVAALEGRLEDLGLKLSNLAFVLLTHLHPERMSGLPLLRSLAPQLKVIGSGAMKTALALPATQEALLEADQKWCGEFAPAFHKIFPLSREQFLAGLKVDETVADGELIEVGGATTVRALHAPGHTASSVSYFVQPHEFLITDEVSGYYRGRELTAPGGDHSLLAAHKTLERFGTLELRALCLPFSGILIGQLIRKHLSSVDQAMADIASEAKSALARGASAEEIGKALLNQCFSPISQDAALNAALVRSSETILAQVLAIKQP